MQVHSRASLAGSFQRQGAAPTLPCLGARAVWVISAVPATKTWEMPPLCSAGRPTSAVSSCVCSQKCADACRGCTAWECWGEGEAVCKGACPRSAAASCSVQQTVCPSHGTLHLKAAVTVQHMTCSGGACRHHLPLTHPHAPCWPLLLASVRAVQCVPLAMARLQMQTSQTGGTAGGCCRRCRSRSWTATQTQV